MLDWLIDCKWEQRDAHETDRRGAPLLEPLDLLEQPLALVDSGVDHGNRDNQRSQQLEGGGLCAGPGDVAIRLLSPEDHSAARPSISGSHAKVPNTEKRLAKRPGQTINQHNEIQIQTEATTIPVAVHY
eukprot:scaffold185170_cov44-Prasinocladus_malaysianus.AAC.1